MGETQKHIESAKRELAELDVLRGELAEQKAMFTPAVLGALMENIDEGIDSLLTKNFFDKDAAKSIGDVIAKAIESVAKMPPPKAPVVNVTPQISVDLKPLQGIATEITQQNKILIAALEKESKDENLLYGLMTKMLARQNDIIDKLVAAMNKPEEKEEQRPMIEKLTARKDQYGNFTLTPEYSKTKK